MNIIGEINCNVNIDGSNPSPQNSSIIGLAMKSSPINIGRLSPIAKLIVLLANLVNSFFSPVIIRFENLGNEYFIYDEERKRLIGEKTNTTYKIGDKVKIRVAKASKLLRQVDFEIVN